MKKINLAQILQRLTTRFKLQEYTREDFLFSETVLPTTNIDNLLLTRRTASANVTRTSAEGTGTFTCYTVPSSKRHYVYAIHLSRSSGDGTLTELKIGSVAATILTQTASQSLVSGIFNQPLVMEQGEVLSVNCNAITTDTTWSVRVYYGEEDAY